MVLPHNPARKGYGKMLRQELIQILLKEQSTYLLPMGINIFDDAKARHVWKQFRIRRTIFIESIDKHKAATIGGRGYSAWKISIVRKFRWPDYTTLRQCGQQTCQGEANLNALISKIHGL